MHTEIVACPPQVQQIKEDALKPVSRSLSVAECIKAEAAKALAQTHWCKLKNDFEFVVRKLHPGKPALVALQDSHVLS